MTKNWKSLEIFTQDAWNSITNELLIHIDYVHNNVIQKVAENKGDFVKNAKIPVNLKWINILKEELENKKVQENDNSSGDMIEIINEK